MNRLKRIQNQSNVTVQDQSVPEGRLRSLPVFVPHLLSPVLSILLIAVIASLGRVHLGGPFFSQLDGLVVSFADGQTREDVTGNTLRILKLALEKRLSYRLEVWRGPLQFGKTLLQATVGWLILFVILFIPTRFISKGWRSRLSLPLATSALVTNRLFEVLSSSAWIWLPGWNTVYVDGLIRLSLGLPLPDHVFVPLLIRMVFWILAKVETLVFLAVLVHFLWRRRFFATVATSVLFLVIAQLAHFFPTQLLYQVGLL